MESAIENGYMFICLMDASMGGRDAPNFPLDGCDRSFGRRAPNSARGGFPGSA